MGPISGRRLVKTRHSAVGAPDAGATRAFGTHPRLRELPLTTPHISLAGPEVCRGAKVGTVPDRASVPRGQATTDRKGCAHEGLRNAQDRRVRLDREGAPGLRADGRDRPPAGRRHPAPPTCTRVWEGAIGERHNMILGHEAVRRGRGGRRAGPGLQARRQGHRPRHHARLELPRGPGAATPCTPAACSQAGSSPTSRTASSREFFHVNDADGNLAHLPDGHRPRRRRACSPTWCPTGFHGVELADVQFGDEVLRHRHRPRGPDVRCWRQRCAAPPASIAVGSRPDCARGGPGLRRNRVSSTTARAASIADQVLEKTDGKGVDRVIIAGGDCRAPSSEAVKMLKPGGTDRQRQLPRRAATIVTHPARGVGLSAWVTKTIARRPDARRPPAHGEARPRSMQTGRLDIAPLITHRLPRLGAPRGGAACS